MIFSALRFIPHFIISVGFIVSFFPSSLHAQTVSENDSLALVAFYNSTNGDEWTRNDYWLEGPVSSWYGIKVHEKKVIEIELSSNSLSYKIPAEIGQLTMLQKLDLSKNQLYWNIPKEIGNLNNLISLDLSNNQLKGNLPIEIGNLNNLEKLNISQNSMEGTIPSELFSLVKLNTLILGGNRLQSIKNPNEIANLTNLQILDISECFNGGEIPPVLGSLSHLQLLDLSWNYLGGEIPSELLNLSELQYLILHKNWLTGTIPFSLFKLPKLLSIDLSDNRFTGLPDIVDNESVTNLQEGINVLDNYLSFEDILPNLDLSNSIDFEYSPQKAHWLPDPLFMKSGGSYTIDLKIDSGITDNVYEWFKNDIKYKTTYTNKLHFENITFDDAGTYYCKITTPRLPKLSLIRGYKINVSLPDGRSVIESDSLALVALYNSTNGESWLENGNWLEGPIGSWNGITIHEGRVKEINLAFNSMKGSFPAEIGDLTALEVLNLSPNRLSGSIPNELGKLINLLELNLTANQLQGEIPSTLGNLSNLTTLRLNTNNFTGSIPKEIGNLEKLIALNLDNNKLQGSIPKELGNLSKLEILELHSNQLEGNIPSELGYCSQLQTLSLWENTLSGTIPGELGNLKNLTNLELSRNHLTGKVPITLGELTELRWLNLYNNQLSGGIPSELSKLTNLNTLYLGNNQFTSIPESFNSFPNTLTLSIDNNKLIELPDLTKVDWVHLYVENNYLTFEDILPIIKPANSSNFTYSPQINIGNAIDTLLSFGENYTIDLKIDVSIISNVYKWLKDGEELTTTNSNTLTLKNLTLDDAGVYTCQVTNPQVPDLTLYSQPVMLNVLPQGGRSVPESDSLALVALYNSTKGDNWTRNDNWLKGRVDTWYGIRVNNFRVYRIDLPYNQLTGEIPSTLGNLTQLFSLYLTDNNLSGEIPTEIGDLNNLYELHLGRNQIEGSLPQELGNLQNLNYLSLGGNNFTGTIPPEIGALKNLRGLGLSSNQLEGNIPPEIGNLEVLETFALMGNKLSGNIPSEIGKLSHLKQILLAGNQLSGSIPPGIGNLSNLTELMLEQNELSNIPPEIGDLSNLEKLSIANNQIKNIPQEIGKLSKLKDLTLFNNQISGPIPEEISNLSNLTILRLSGNNFQGSIPLMLTKLSNLSWLLLDDNQLSGNIPSEIFELPNLSVLYLSNNQFSGPIPPEIDKLTKLSVLELSGNQLSGHIPSELGNLSELRYLYLGNNEFSGDLPESIAKLPNLAVITINNNAIQNLSDLANANWKFNPNSQFLTENNQLTFEDILPNISISDIAKFLYSPQDSIGQTETIKLESGETYTIHLGIDSTITTNEYRWFKDNVEIVVTHQNSFSITEVTPTDAGMYTCEVTNPAVDSLTLYSRPVTLIVQAAPIPQTITFDAIPDKMLGEAAFELSATASSGLPVRFTVEGPALLEGTLLTLTDTGRVTITAAQAGNENYLAAEEVIRSFLIQVPAFNLSGKVSTEAGEAAGSGTIILYTPNEKGRLTTFKTGRLQADGSYLFAGLKAGNYSMGVIPDDPGFLTTYLGNVVIRSEATFISLNQDTENQNITLVSKTNTLTGDATVSGILILEESIGGGRVLVGAEEVEGTPLPAVRVYLMSAFGEVISTDVTDTEGRFSFANIPVGTYEFKADYEGLPHDTDNFTISVAHKDIEVTALIARDGIVRVQGVSVVTGIHHEIANAPVLLYPNPTEGKFKIILDAYWFGGTVSICHLSGQQIRQQAIPPTPLTFDLSHEQAGIYVITLQKGETWQIMRVSKF